MRVFLRFIFFITLTSLTFIVGVDGVSSQEAKPVALRAVFEDVLIFRIQSRNLFLSDLKTYADSLVAFHCLFPKAQVLKFSNLSKEKIKKLQTMAPGNASGEAAFFDDFRKLIALQIFHNSQSLSLESDFDLGLQLSKCQVGRYSSWDNELKSLVQAELVMIQGLRDKGAKEQTSFLNSLRESLDQSVDFESFL